MSARFLGWSVALLCWCALCRAADDGSPRRAVPTDGEPFTASLIAVTDEIYRWRIGDEVRELPREGLVQWGSAADVERGAQFVLTDGSVLVGDILQLGSEEITIGDAAGLARGFWQNVKIPLRSLRGILVQPSADPLARDRQIFKLNDDSLKQDEFTLVGGETITGVLLPGTTNPETQFLERFRLQVRGLPKPLEIAPAKTLAIALNASFADPVRGRRRMMLMLDDGSRLSLVSIKAERGRVELELTNGLKLHPVTEGPDAAAEFAGRVCFVQPTSPRVRYLSDGPPLALRHTPVLTTDWPPTRDSNVLGGGLRVHETVFLRGWGTHAPTEITYPIPARTQRFEAEVGIDRAARRRGSVQFAVLLQQGTTWREAFVSPILRGGDSPLAIVVPIENAERIRLETRIADRSDQGDFANWGDARWILAP